jgi:hypothetical protein
MWPVLVFWIGATTSTLQAALSRQTPPALVAETGGVSASRGGTAQAFRIASSILNESRRILIVLPSSYSQSAAARRYPVTVVLDGESLIPVVAAVSDELSRNGQIPESVIVGIANVEGGDFLTSNTKRVHDLTPPGLSVSGSSRSEGGDLFLNFIEQEVLPAVDRQFRTAAPRTLIGHSSGAILATYAAATRSTYRAVVSLDAPVQLDANWLAKKLTARAAAPAIPVRYASLEAKFGWQDGEWAALVQAAPASWMLSRETLPLEGHETVPMLGTYLGLRQLFSDYSRFAVTDLTTMSILPHYARVGAALGAAVTPPRRVLQDVTDDLLSEGRGTAARDAYNMLVLGYGAPANSAAVLARIADVERRPPPAETVEALLAAPFPTPEEARAYIGDWVGDVWMGPDEPRTGKQTLRIRVENGKVIGEIFDSTTSAEPQVRRVQYLRVTPTGLTWGNLNGMRPRGVMMFEGKLEGDTLVGDSRWGGIDFRLPDGSRQPPLHFSFKRVPRKL